jgi:hypothetical protein
LLKPTSSPVNEKLAIVVNEEGIVSYLPVIERDSLDLGLFSFVSELPTPASPVPPIPGNYARVLETSTVWIYTDRWGDSSTNFVTTQVSSVNEETGHVSVTPAKLGVYTKQEVDAKIQAVVAPGFSTTERATGRLWDDGRMVYERVFIGKGLADSTIDDGATNTRTVVIATGFTRSRIIRSSGMYKTPSGAEEPMCHTWNGKMNPVTAITELSRYWFRANGEVAVNIYSASGSYNNAEITIIAEYVK